MTLLGPVRHFNITSRNKLVYLITKQNNYHFISAASLDSHLRLLRKINMPSRCGGFSELVDRTVVMDATNDSAPQPINDRQSSDITFSVRHGMLGIPAK